MIDIQTATAEITSWLDAKKVRTSRREEREGQIKDLIGAIQDGILEYNPEDHTLKHKLLFPLEAVDTITYKHRLNQIDLEGRLKGVSGMDADGRLTAYIGALTGQPLNVARKMDTEDRKISESIALFF